MFPGIRAISAGGSLMFQSPKERKVGVGPRGASLA
jgi:hypothetical protein